MLSHTFSVEQNWIYLLHEIKKISDLEPKNNLKMIPVRIQFEK